MTLNFYKNASDIRVLNKDLGKLIKTAEGVVLKEDTSIFNPTFKLRLFNNFNINYCYCPEFDRYYYIDDIVFSGQILEISCHEDVLMSFKDEILNRSALINRNENIVNHYIKDDRLELQQNETISIKTLGYDMQRDCNYYLCVSGGE